MATSSVTLTPASLHASGDGRLAGRATASRAPLSTVHCTNPGLSHRFNQGSPSRSTLLSHRSILTRGLCISGRNASSSRLPYKKLPVLVKASADVSDAEVEAVEEDAMERMDKTLENVKSNFNTIRTGRASPSLLDRVEVEYYGTNVTLKSIAQISTPDSSTLAISPFDKSSIQAIEKALLQSDVGLTPNSDGSIIRLSIPQLTQERRKELLKTASKLAEEGKVAIRNVRRDAVKSYEKLEKDKKISEDGRKGHLDDVQKLTDEYVKQIDVLLKQKEKDLLTV